MLAPKAAFFICYNDWQNANWILPLKRQPFWLSKQVILSTLNQRRSSNTRNNFSVTKNNFNHKKNITGLTLATISTRLTQSHTIDVSTVFSQGSVISQIEWASFKSLFWKTNDSITNLTISFTSNLSLWDRPCYQNMLIYESDGKCRKPTTV